MNRSEIMARLEAFRTGDLPTHGGRTLAYVYDGGLAEADEIGRQALGMFSSANGLDPTAFPSLLTMENELVAMAGELVDGPGEMCGTLTSGGTESILLAVLAAREAASGTDRPALVMPSSAHAAFHKAAHYFGVDAVVVPVDPATGRADAAAMAAAIDERTVLVVASAPSYAHGVIDPVPEIAAAAAARGVRCHVDACIGGWVLPFVEDGRDRPTWTFAVDGVTSISVDLHKYAYTPKGASLLLYRTPALRRAQYYACADWPGYTMLNATTQSTRSGGPIAAAWAVTRFIGLDRYRQLARAALAGARQVADGIDRLPHLRLMFPPDATLVALATDEALDVFTVADEMQARGWYTQPQMAFDGFPPTLHLTLSAATAPHVPEFLAALASAVDAAVSAGPVPVDPALREAAAGLDPSTLDDAAFDALLQIAGLAGGDGSLALPTRMAPVNALLNVAPPRVREALLIAFLDRLARPTPPPGP